MSDPWPGMSRALEYMEDENDVIFGTILEGRNITCGSKKHVC